jgi:hypothetical protein
MTRELIESILEDIGLEPLENAPPKETAAPEKR